MTIKEKLEATSDGAGKRIHLFKEGVFWIAYEQCAYWFHLQKGYKPTKKLVKVVGQEVVSVGFPESVLERLTELHNGTDGTNGTLVSVGDKMKVFALNEEIDLKKFEEWKSGLSLTVKKEATSEILGTGGTDEAMEKNKTIEERIKAFDLWNKTPMDCMTFLTELKKEFGL